MKITNISFKRISVNLSKQYTLDASWFRAYSSFKDSIRFFEFDAVLEHYYADHNPQFTFFISVLNFIILDLTIYNTGHVFDNAKQHPNDLSWLNKHVAYAPNGEVLMWVDGNYIGESGQTLTLEEVEEMEDEDIII